jgi:D-alanyl-D-alanine carboxypeptidase
VILLLIPVALIALLVWYLNRPPAEEAPGGDTTTPTGEGAEGETQPTDATAATEPVTVAEPDPVPVSWNLILVNAQNELPAGFEDALELESLTGEFMVDRRIIDSYTRMSNQAKQDGADLMVCSAYRSYEKQTELFEGRKAGYLAEGMDEEEAIAATLQYTTLPGTSEHHTGLAVDIVTPTYQNLDAGYAETTAAKWLKENAADYGFILRYPEGKEGMTQVDFEPWHYRYVGEEAAAVIMEQGYCLEEYFMYVLRSGGEPMPQQAPEGDPNEEPTEEPEEE